MFQTGPDLEISANIDDPNFRYFDTNGNLLNGPIPTMDSVRLDAFGIYRNQTVNLLPFLAFLHDKGGRNFFQGFLQVDVGANSSSGSLDIDYEDDFARQTESVAGDIALQTILRVNAGWGHRLGGLGRFRGHAD